MLVNIIIVALWQKVEIDEDDEMQQLLIGVDNEAHIELHDDVVDVVVVVLMVDMYQLLM